MSYKTVEERVRNITADVLGVDKDDVHADSSFTNDLGADSLDMVELIIGFERDFSISIPDEISETFKTPDQVVEFVRGKTQV